MSVLITLRELGIGDDRRKVHFDRGFEIVAEDGRSLFDVRVNAEGLVEISCAGFVKHDRQMLSDTMIVRPRTCSTIYVERMPYPKETP